MKFQLTKEEIEKLKPQDRMMRGIRLNHNISIGSGTITLLLFLIVLSTTITTVLIIWGITEREILLLPIAIISAVVLILGILSFKKEVKTDKEIEKEYREKINE